jgi:hypothetical protein
MQTPEERPPPEAIRQKPRELRTYSDQLLRQLNHWMQESEQRRQDARIRLDKILEQWHPQ